MHINSLCALILTLTVACTKPAATTMKELPKPDTTVIADTYPVVTAANSIALSTGTTYRVALVQYASFFNFDRSVANGDLYYEAILQSKKQFSPLKFYIQNNGSGKITAVANASDEEIAAFKKAWQQ